ncbi:hypothetical protein ARALYDRAFT_358185 [Arabidopsis lyrata subsp. lyrata]|uniref:Malectin-like domain-containing protein n=1 Tax=Arabidopsis lyrata subsp. lyrata TaxID=81972 RepID=D7MSH1_ARALL|nr:hypothetical protein ARALYDRAFT_358185 [Arabidopsis lyrata subsp. lyrata]
MGLKMPDRKISDNGVFVWNLLGHVDPLLFLDIVSVDNYSLENQETVEDVFLGHLLIRFIDPFCKEFKTQDILPCCQRLGLFLGFIYLYALFLSNSGIGAFAVIGCVRAQDQQEFISLDCGLPVSEPSSYVESVTGLRFSSDAEFIQTGKSGKIQANMENDYLKPYPDDVYDRRWRNFFLVGWTQISTTLEVSNDNDYQPPKKALAAAATPSNATTSLRYKIYRPMIPGNLTYYGMELLLLKLSSLQS